MSSVSLCIKFIIFSWMIQNQIVNIAAFIIIIIIIESI